MLLHQYILETNSIGKTVDISLHEIFKKGIMCKVDNILLREVSKALSLLENIKKKVSRYRLTLRYVIFMMKPTKVSVEQNQRTNNKMILICLLLKLLKWPISVSYDTN